VKKRKILQEYLQPRFEGDACGGGGWICEALTCSGLKRVGGLCQQPARLRSVSTT
jgi:hypothetical protein